MKVNESTTAEAVKTMNNVIGETFATYNSMSATYVLEKDVSEGFSNIIRALPSRTRDHIIFGKRSDGQYVGISQPYPIGTEEILETIKYCKAVGLDMTIGGTSTWNVECTRIMFQRDDDNIDRFDIAVNSSRWHNIVNTIDTWGFVDEVERRFKERGV